MVNIFWSAPISFLYRCKNIWEWFVLLKGAFKVFIQSHFFFAIIFLLTIVLFILQLKYQTEVKAFLISIFTFFFSQSLGEQSVIKASWIKQENPPGLSKCGSAPYVLLLSLRLPPEDVAAVSIEQVNVTLYNIMTLFGRTMCHTWLLLCLIRNTSLQGITSWFFLKRKFIMLFKWVRPITNWYFVFFFTYITGYSEHPWYSSLHGCRQVEMTDGNAPKCMYRHLWWGSVAKWPLRIWKPPLTTSYQITYL